MSINMAASASMFGLALNAEEGIAIEKLKNIVKHRIKETVFFIMQKAFHSQVFIKLLVIVPYCAILLDIVLAKVMCLAARRRHSNVQKSRF